MADKQEKILELTVRYDKAIEAIVDYRNKIDAVKNSEKELKKQLKEKAIHQEDYDKQMIASKAKITEYNNCIRVLNKEVQNNLKVQQGQEDSLVSLRAELSMLTAQYDNMSKVERESADGKALQNKINSVTDELKGCEEETQRFYRNVGNYEGSLAPLFEELNKKLDTQKKKYQELVKTNGEHSKEAQKQKKAIQDTQLELDLFSSSADKANGNILGLISSGTGLDASLIKTFSQLGTLANGAKMAGNAFSALGKQMLALMANPVIAFLGIVAVALLAISKGITSSEENTNRLKVALAPFNRILQDGIKILQSFAGIILSVVETGGKLLGWVNKMCESLPVLGKYFEESNNKIAEGIELEKEKQLIEKQGRKDEVQNAKDALVVSELRNKAKDKEKYTAKERLEFVKQANKLEDEQSKRNVELAERKLKALQTESKWAENDAETNQKLADLEADVYNARKEYYDKTRRLKENENSLINETKSDEKAALEAKKQAAEKAVEIAKDRAAKERDAVRTLEDSLLSIITDSREKQRKTISLNYDRQIEDLKAKLRTETNLTINARNAINKTIIAKEKEKQQALNKLSQEELQKEISERQKLIETQLAGVKEGSDVEYQLKMQSLQTQREAELANTELTEQMKLAIKDKYNKQLDDLTSQHNNDILNKQQEAIKLQFETELEYAYGNEVEMAKVKMDQRKAELDSIQQMEGESIEAFNLRKLQAENDYISSKQDVANKEIEIEQAKYQAMNDITDGLISLTEEIGESDRNAAMASKVIALAQIAINTGEAIAKMVSVESGKGIAGVATMAAGIATILSNIASAIKTVKSAKFANGGLVTGPGTETSDSIPAQLSKNESVITARATSMFAPMLSAFNMMGGGVPINVTATNNQSIGEDMLARAVAKGVMMAPAPVVSVEEVTSVANRVKYLENNGNL